MSHLSNVWFHVTDLEIARGEGSWVITADGERYLDFTSGIAVTSTGHAHPTVVDAVAAQAARGIHLQPNCYQHDLLEPLAARLAAISPTGIDTFFFANSGAEITEASVKLAKQATGRPNIIVFQGSFHGRTHLGMAMTTSKAGYRSGHSPLPSGVHVAPFPDLRAGDTEHEVRSALAGLDRLLAEVTSPDETAAMIIEPVLGEGGYLPVPAAFLGGVADRCARHDVLLIVDEVQTGFGRSGRMFAIDHYDVAPDIVCMAKGIASGFPFAALGTSRALDACWPTGSHGGTYGGNPMGCAAALATIEVLCADGFMDTVNHRSTQLMTGLVRLAELHRGITHVRGLGLLIGIDFATSDLADHVRGHCLEAHHVILMSAGGTGTTLRFMPPLTVMEAEIERALDAVENALTSWLA